MPNILAYEAATVEEDSSKAKAGPPAHWDEFIKEKYQDGKKQVPNPNPETRKRFPQVAFNSAMKDKSFRDHAMKEYKEWLGKENDTAPTSKKVKEVLDHVIEIVKPAQGSPLTSLQAVLAGGKEIPDESLTKALSQIKQQKVYSQHSGKKEQLEALDALEKVLNSFGKKAPTPKVPEKEKPTKKVAPKSKKHPLGITHNDIQKVLETHREEFKKLAADADKEIEAYETNYASTAGTEEKKKWLKTHFGKLSRPQKLLHVIGHKFGEHFQKSVISKDVRATQRDVTDEWIDDSGLPECQKMHGFLSSLGYNGSPTPREKKDDVIEEQRQSGKSGPERARLEKYFKETYTYTQAVFEHLGVSELTLFRGVSGQGLDKEPPDVGDTVELTTREMSSYTTNPRVSDGFGRSIEFKVPVDRVFESCLTSPEFGSKKSSTQDLGEAEMCILGGSDIQGKLIKGAATNKYAASKTPFKIHLDEANENWLHGKKKKDKDKKKASDLAMAHRVVARVMSTLR